MLDLDGASFLHPSIQGVLSEELHVQQIFQDLVFHAFIRARILEEFDGILNPSGMEV